MVLLMNMLVGGGEGIKSLVRFISRPDLVTFIKMERLLRACHVSRMDSSEIPKELLFEELGVGTPKVSGSRRQNVPYPQLKSSRS